MKRKALCVLLFHTQLDVESPALTLTINDDYQQLDSPYVVVPPSDSAADDLLTSVIGHYKSDLKGLGTNVINLRDVDDYKTTNNVSKYILDIAYSDLGRYKYNHLVAAEFR